MSQPNSDANPPEEEPTIPPFSGKEELSAEQFDEATIPPEPKSTPEDNAGVIDGNETLPPNTEIGKKEIGGPSPAAQGGAQGIDTLPQSSGDSAWQEGGRIQYFGDYQLINEIARGGMGVVYRAKQTSLNRIVALKMILAGQLAGDEEVQRFHAEAEAAANLDHPGIVPIYEVGEFEGQHYFSMGFVDGSSLADVIAEHPLAAEEAADVTSKIAEAIGYAHEHGVIHRDLKPANVLVPRKREAEASTLKVGSTQPSSTSSVSLSGRSTSTSGLAPRVTDFGLAKQVQGDENLTASGQVLGTPNYMPPEQAAGKLDEIDHRADIYSLGGILYALLTGRPPFQAANQLDTLIQVLEKDPVPPRQLAPKLPRDIETIALKALEKDPKRRYQSAEEMSGDLQRFLNHEPIHARSITPVERAWRWCKRKPAVAALAAVASLLVLLLSIGGPLVAIQQGKFASEQQRLQQVASAEKNAALLAKGQAEAATQEVAREQERSQGLLYATRISLAHREWLDGNPSRTRQLLSECPPEKRNWEWEYLDGLTRAEDTVIFAHGIPAQIDFSPNGKTLLTRGQKDQGLAFWDADSGLEKDSTVIPSLTNAETVSNSDILVMAGDAVVVAQAMDDQGESKPKIKKEFGNFRSIALGAKVLKEAGELATAFGDGSVIFYDLENGQELRRMPKKRQTELPHVFSPDAKLVVGVREHRVRIWEVATGEELFEVAGHVGKVEAVAFSPDGKTLASAGRGGALFLTEVETGRRLHEVRSHEAGIKAIDFSRDGSQIVTGSQDRTARIYKVSNGNELLVIRGHEGAITDVAFHPDGSRVATSSEDGSVRIWSIDGKLTVAPEIASLLQGASHLGHEIGLESRVLYGQRGMIYDVQVSPNGEYVATSAVGADQGDNQIRVWSRAEATAFAGFPVPTGLLHTLEFSADSKYLLVGSGGAGDALAPGSVAIWDLESKQRLRTIEGDSCMFIRPVLNSANDILAVLYGNLTYGYVRFYSFPEGELLHEQEVRDQRLAGIAWSKTSDTLITSTAPGGLVQLWDAKTGEEADRFTANAAGVFAVDVSQHGQLATANIDGTIGIWDLNTKQQLAEMRGHSKYAVDVSFSPDGKRLLSSSEDETVKVWDLGSFSELLTFRDHRSPALCADWSADGSTLATTSRDGTLILRELKQVEQFSESDVWVTVFEDDFERSELGNNWLPTTPDGWKIENGKLIGTLQSTAMPGTTFPAAFIGLASVDLPRVVEIEADVQLRQPMFMQFVLLNKRTQQYIAPFVSSTARPYNFVGSAIQVARGAGEQTKILGSRNGTKFEVGTNYRVKVIRDGDGLQFFVDDELLSDTRVPALEADQLSLSGCWSQLGDQIEFDNVVVRIPESLVREVEIRNLVNGWLTDYLIPQLVAERIRKEFPEGTEDRKIAINFLRGLNANDAFSAKDVVAAIERVVNRPDATAEQYEIAAQQADIYMGVQPDHWWIWSKFGLAYMRDGQLEKALQLLEKADARCKQQEGHPYPLALAAQALTLHALERHDEAEAVHSRLDDFMINQWKPIGLADLKQELEQKVPLKSDELRDELLLKIRASRRAIYNAGNAVKELADFADDVQVTQGRAMRADQHDVKYDRDSFLQLESIYCTSFPIPNLHLVWDQFDVKRNGDRVTIALIEHMKNRRPDQSTISVMRFGLGYQFEKREDQWFITKHRVWQVDRQFGGEWSLWNAEHWQRLDEQVAELQQGEDLLELARVCYDAGRAPEALEAAMSVADNESAPTADRARALVLAGQCQIALSQFRDGIASLEEARKLHPTVSMPWFLTRQKAAYQSKAAAFSIAFSGNATQMASSHNGGKAILWDLKTTKQIRSFDANVRVAADLAYFDEGRKLVTGGFDTAVNTFDVASGNRLNQYTGHLGVIFRLESHPQRPEIVITSSGDRTAKVWDLDAGRELFSLSGHAGQVMTAAFSPDGNWIATGSTDTTIRIWDAKSGREIHRHDAHKEGVWRVDWTPDGSRLMSCGRDQMVRVWATESWEELAELTGHQTAIEAIRIRPDGKLAASGDVDGIIYVWDLETLTPLRVFNSHTDDVYDLQFYEGDLFSASGDGTIRRWNVDFSKSPLLEALERVSSN